jgi:hypothetical protein
MSFFIGAKGLTTNECGWTRRNQRNEDTLVDALTQVAAVVPTAIVERVDLEAAAGVERLGTR